MTNFNTGPSPQLGFFAENLACSTPGINGGDYIFTEQDSTYTMFQMLQAWQDTFKNPEKTEVCNSDTNGPDIAMKYAFDNFNTRYFEVYPADLDYIGYWDALQEWHDFFASSLE